MPRAKPNVGKPSFHFAKMHGLGNDFVVLDARSGSVVPDAAQIAELSDRHRGIGFDQFLVLESSDHDGAFSYRIYNADGSQAQQCGNGMRCLARYVFTHGLTPGNRITFFDGRQRVHAYLENDEDVTINMGCPVLDPKAIPFQATCQAESYELMVNGLNLEIGVISMGNPHAVLRVDHVKNAAVEEIGSAIESHNAFPERTNVGFLEIKTPREVRLRVWERGTGETLACGSGACAAVVWGRLMGWLERDVSVSLPGGRLQVRCSEDGDVVWLRGPAVEVYEGDICET